MKWESKRRERINKKANWHDFFTLLPRLVKQGDGKPDVWVWLETIERQSYIWEYDSDYWIINYRLKTN
jgi:hypothetical protein